VTAVGIVFAIIVLGQSTAPASLGDWGDYLGGIFAAFGFIWLIVAHVHGQRQIRDGQKDLENQMALTQEVVASLSRLAMSAQLQDAVRMVELLPVFTDSGSGGTAINPHSVMSIPVSWHARLENQGEGVTLVEAISRTEGVTVTVDRLGACPKGKMFVVNFASKGPIKKLGNLRCYLRFEDQLQRGGYADMTVDTNTPHTEVSCHMGEPPAPPESPIAG